MRLSDVGELYIAKYQRARYFVIYSDPEFENFIILNDENEVALKHQ